MIVALTAFEDELNNVFNISVIEMCTLPSPIAIIAAKIASPNVNMTISLLRDVFITCYLL